MPKRQFTDRAVSSANVNVVRRLRLDDIINDVGVLPSDDGAGPACGSPDPSLRGHSPPATRTDDRYVPVDMLSLPSCEGSEGGGGRVARSSDVDLPVGEDTAISALSMLYGLYEFVVMPFGLCNVSGTFQHAMNRIFHNYLDKFIVVYLDDILIFSRIVEEHAEHLKTVLGLLRQHQYKVNLDKCEFGRTKILYLGHEILADGLRPEDAKVASIRDWPIPQTVTEVRSFLGMTGYYRPFVKNYSTIASPLTDLTRLDTPWEWTEECEASFKKFKYALTHYEVLKLPDPDKPFVVTTDASRYGIGAVLAQQEGPKLRPIEYMSKKMPSQKLAKSTYEREFYALYRALVHWRHYLLGRFFYVRSDHETLRWIKTQPVLSDALKRWIQVIDMYDYQLDPIKGAAEAQRRYRTVIFAVMDLSSTTWMVWRKRHVSLTLGPAPMVLARVVTGTMPSAVGTSTPQEAVSAGETCRSRFTASAS
ncbi:hypothetical protein CBR_g6449 [Chara braunii]|uniref:Reverse transcriptase domain-containing protein n=1 Tax=Chara braunii TaxID=69332 RepID=A0A388KJU4_CHABU|nr:hypothetical protein CBR_g6449 [Chara braunii]|eukprot:GBG70321.1 hypothetical protein CBR_g6449 [Chara braunii]